MERTIDIYANKLGDEKLGMFESLKPALPLAFFGV